MALLIVFAALAGYHWGTIIQNVRIGVQEHDVIILGMVFSVLAVLTALLVEAVVTRTEREAALAEAAVEEKALEARLNSDQALELDRMVNKLSEDNRDLRYRLMSAKVHELSEDMVHDVRACARAISKAS